MKTSAVSANFEKCIGLFHERIAVPDLQDFSPTEMSDAECVEVLGRVLGIHPELSADKTPGLVCDRLFPYSIIMRKTPILTGISPYHPIFLDTKEDLKELRAHGGTDPGMWPDGRLCNLNNRLNHYKRIGSPLHITYRNLWDEVFAIPFISDFSYAPPNRLVIEKDTTGKLLFSKSTIVPFESFLLKKFMQIEKANS